MYLTLNDAAARLDVSPATLRRACAAGRIPGAVRIGGPRTPWRVPVSYLDGATPDTTRPRDGVETVPGSLAHDRPTRGGSGDYVTPARTTIDRARRVSRSLVVDTRPAVALRVALDGIVDARARHYPGRDGWCVACQWQYPCPDASTLDATVAAVAAAVLDGDRP